MDSPKCPPPPPSSAPHQPPSPSSSGGPESVSQKLLTVRGVEGRDLWIEDNEEVWTRAKVLSQANTMLTCQRDRDESLVNVDLGFATTSFAEEDYTLPDMTSLEHIHEAALLQTLQTRYVTPEGCRPYTYMGNVLVAVNPLSPVEHPEVKQFSGLAFDPTRPHPFGIAEAAYQQLHLQRLAPGCSEGTDSTSRQTLDLADQSLANNQAIVISGESGAGKSVTGKMVINYLVRRASWHSPTSPQKGVMLDERFVQSTPLLESFGNAATIRNADSSRFGKFTLASFTDVRHEHEMQGPPQPFHLKLQGGQIETYLLEKSRVVRLASGERNFHVFYQMLAGLKDHPMAKELGIFGKTAADFTYLKSSGRGLTRAPSNVTTNADPSKWGDAVIGEDKEGFKRLTSALDIFEIDAKEAQPGLWRALAAILHLGNVRMGSRESAAEGTVAAVVEGADIVASLLGVDQETLVDLLTKRQVTTRGETFIVPLTPTDGAFARDAVAKDMYSRLFHWIARKVNANLRSLSKSSAAKVATPTLSPTSPEREAPQRVIGILDIFGFESLERNGFEQLCINHANEWLQHLFNDQLFSAELELYRHEGIAFSVSSRPDNSECLSLLLAKPLGILPSLDTASASLEPSDDRFVSSLHRNLVGHPFFPNTHASEKHRAFKIRHFAGEVKYQVGGDWVAKNNDTIPEGLPNMLATCKSSALVEDVFAPLPPAPGASAHLPPKSAKRKETVCSRFLGSMDRLSAALASTRCSFVRCVKPNASMSPSLFDRKYVVGQLRCLGLVQSCEVLKVGLPTRIKYADLRTHLASLPKATLDMFEGEGEEAMISAALMALEVPPEAYHLGRTRVFFKTGHLAYVRKILDMDMSVEGRWVGERMAKALEQRWVAYKVLAHANEASERLTDSEGKAKEEYSHLLDLEAQAHASIKTADAMLLAMLEKLYECDARVCSAREVSNSLPTFETEEGKESLAAAMQHLVQAAAIEAPVMQAVAHLHRELKVFSEELGVGNWKEASIVAWEKIKAIEKLSAELEAALAAATRGAERCEPAPAEDAVDLGEAILSEHVTPLLDSLSAQLQSVVRAQEKATALEVRSLQQQEAGAVAIEKIGQQLSAMHAKLAEARQRETESLERQEREARDAALKAQRDAEAAQAAEALRVFKERTSAVLMLNTPPTGPEPRPQNDATPPEPRRPPPAEEEGDEGSDSEDEDEAPSRANEQQAQEQEGLSMEQPPQPPGPPSARLIRRLSSSRQDVGEDNRDRGEEKADSPRSAAQAMLALQSTPRLPASVRSVGGLNVASVRSARNAGPLPVLPPGWMETISATYTVPYYTNKFTGESQWERPTAVARSKSGRFYPLHHEVPAAEEEDDEVQGPLPAHWRIYLSEAHNGLPYYFNKRNGVTVWERPIHKAGEEADEEDAPKREQGEQGEEDKNKAGQLKRAESGAAGSAKAIFQLPKPKEGYVLKRSSALITTSRPWPILGTGRWKKRYLALEDGLMKMYKDKGHTTGSDRKTLELDPDSTIGSTGFEKGIVVSSGATRWFLVLQSEHEKTEWVAAITAHIQERRREAERWQQDLLEDGNRTGLRRLYRMDDDQSLPSIAVRLTPEMEAPRNALIKPGDVIEVHSIVADVKAGVLFLGLSGEDKKGWVLDRNSQTRRVLMRRVPGRFEAIPAGQETYRVSTELKGVVPILRMPLTILKDGEGYERCVENGAYVRVLERFTIDPTLQSQQGREVSGAGKCLEWLKIDPDGAGQPGWVPMIRPITGQVLFRAIQPLQQAR